METLTPLKAIKKYCFECSGENRAQVRGCSALGCPLYPFRLGHGAGRQMTEEQRQLATERLQKYKERQK